VDVTTEDERFMRAALEEERLADFPFGAMIVPEGPASGSGAAAPGFAVMSAPAVDTAAAALRCSMAPANYSPAGGAMAWSMRANKKPCTNGVLARHKKSEPD
jgi:hypothetical protein